MLRERLIWIAKCLLLCLLGVILAARIYGVLTPMAWWILHERDLTTLSRAMFTARFFLPLMPLYGLLLGLIPWQWIAELCTSSVARFHNTHHHQKELDLRRPALWAWLPIGLLWLFRVATFDTGRDSSVLGRTTIAEGRFHHFFALPTSTDFTAYNVQSTYDRIIFTGPMLFLLAYPLGVWVRHQLPSLTPTDGPRSDAPHDPQPR